MDSKRSAFGTLGRIEGGIPEGSMGDRASGPESTSPPTLTVVRPAESWRAHRSRTRRASAVVFAGLMGEPVAAGDSGRCDGCGGDMGGRKGNRFCLGSEPIATLCAPCTNGVLGAMSAAPRPRAAPAMAGETIDGWVRPA